MCRTSMRRVCRAFLAAGLSILGAHCGESTPTSPERHGIPQVTIICAVGSTTGALCRAPVSCSLYPCAAGTPPDVTEIATWTIDDPSVARIVAPGVMEAVAPGHTVIRVAWSSSSYFRPFGVFPGTAPLMTYEYEGNVYDGARAPRTPLDGVLVEILSGLPAGRSTVTGRTPDSYPGATLHASPGWYGFFGIPEGTYRLRVSKDGYVTQEVDTRQFADVTLVPK